jgi:hypothetical protein
MAVLSSSSSAPSRAAAPPAEGEDEQEEKNVDPRKKSSSMARHEKHESAEREDHVRAGEGFLRRVFASISWTYRATMTILVMIVFKIYALITSCFMTLPVLLPINAHPSKDDREGGPIIPYWIETKIKFWCFLHIVFNVQVPERWVKNAYARLIELNKNVADAETQEIPTITVGPDFDHKKFFREYVKRPHPVVLKGFAKESPAVQKWSVDWVVENFGNEKALTKTLMGDNIPGRVRDINTPGTYLHNCEAIFVNHPELVEDLELSRLLPFVSADGNPKNPHLANNHPRAGPLPIQFFLGRGGTGTGFHCANGFNWFYMIEGSKKWTFVDPRWTVLTFPALNRGALYQSCAVTDPNTVLDKYKPLWRVCPRYAAILEEGDVLLNPPWWWHCIENLTKDSTAVATRWMDTKTLRPLTGIGTDANRLFTAFQIFSPVFLKLQFSLIMRGNHATPDEHTRLETDEDLEKQHAERAAKGAQHEDATRVTEALNSNEEQDAYKAYYAKKWGYVDRLPKSNVQMGETRDDVESNRFDQGQGKWTMDTMNFRGR